MIASSIISGIAATVVQHIAFVDLAEIIVSCRAWYGGSVVDPASKVTAVQKRDKIRYLYR